MNDPVYFKGQLITDPDLAEIVRKHAETLPRFTSRAFGKASVSEDYIKSYRENSQPKSAVAEAREAIDAERENFNGHNDRLDNMRLLRLIVKIANALEELDAKASK